MSAPFSGSLIIAAATAPAVSSYVGPGDVVTLTVFYGVRAYNNSYAAALGNAFDLRRSSDNATMTATFLSTGDLDTATISAWAGGSNIFISKAYDHTGGGRHLSQATTASQPQLLLSGGANGRPYVKCASGTTHTLVSASAFTPSTAIVGFMTVANRTSGTTIAAMMIETNFNADYFGGANQTAIAGASGSVFATATDNAWHSTQSIINGSSSVITVDGTDTTGTTTGSTAGGSIQAFMSGSNETNYEECGFIDGTAWTSGQRSSLRSNQQAYYSTP